MHSLCAIPVFLVLLALPIRGEVLFGIDANGNFAVVPTMNETFLVNGTNIIQEISTLRSANTALTSALERANAEMRAAQSTLHTLVQPLLLRNGLGKIRLFGGFYQGRDSVKILSFDGTSWEEEAVLLTNARYAGAGFLYNRGACVLGGFSGGVYADFECLTIDTTMTPVVNKSAFVMANGPRSAMGVVVYRDRIIGIGGRTPTDVASVDIFDGTGWSSGPSLNQARSRLAAVVYQDVVYAIGGHISGSALSSVERWAGGNWTMAPSLNVARWGHGAVVHQGFIFVVGGTTPDVERFDGAAWTVLPARISTQRIGVSLVVFLGRIFAIGGTTAPANFQSSVEFFDGSVWTRTTPLPSPIEYAAAVVY